MADVVGSFDTFERDIRIATEGMSPEEAADELAAFAKDEVARLIASGEASASFERFVNGVKGAPEESVVPPGPIIYVFRYWNEIITAGLEELKKRVPVRSGRYAASFIVLANGAPTRDYDAIPLDAEVVIFNTQPYTRKIESGGNAKRNLWGKITSGRGKDHFGYAKQTLNRRFRGTVDVQELFLNVEPGVAPGVPYIIRGFNRTLAKQNRRSSAFRAGRKYLSTRKDRAPGQPITYPALTLNLTE